MLIGEPGSRLKVCDQCGMQWVEQWSAHFAPERLFRPTDYKVELCSDCKDRYNTYIKRHIHSEIQGEYLIKE